MEAKNENAIPIQLEKGLLKRDEIYEITRSAKNNNILVKAHGFWAVIININFDEYLKILRETYASFLSEEITHYMLPNGFKLEFETVKYFPEKHFALIRMKATTYEGEKEEIENKEPEVAYETARHKIIRYRAIRRVFSGTYVIDENSQIYFKKNELMTEREIINYKVEDKDSDEPMNFVDLIIDKYGSGFVRVDEKTMLFIECLGKHRVFRLEKLFIDEKILYELSKYYVVIMPYSYIWHTHNTSSKYDRYTIVIYVYYNGKKIRLIFNSGKQEPPRPLQYVRRRRYGITKTIRKIKPYKIWVPTSATLSGYQKFFDSLIELYEKIKDRNIKTWEVSPLEQTLDIFFMRDPKRKLKHILKYKELTQAFVDKYHRVVTYMQFPGVEWEFDYGETKRFLGNYQSIRITPDGKISFLVRTQIKGTAIFIKGPFEKEYIEINELKPLLRMIYSRKQKRLERLLQEMNICKQKAPEAFNVNIPFKKSLNLFLELNSEHRHTMLSVLVDIYKRKKYKNLNKAIETIVALMRKSSSKELTLENLESVLKAIRIAAKYHLKEHGWSKYGIRFSGSPEQIRIQVLKIIEKMRSRGLALIMSRENMETIKNIEINLRATKFVEV